EGRSRVGLEVIHEARCDEARIRINKRDVEGRRELADPTRLSAHDDRLGLAQRVVADRVNEERSGRDRAAGGPAGRAAGGPAGRGGARGGGGAAGGGGGAAAGAGGPARRGGPGGGPRGGRPGGAPAGRAAGGPAGRGRAAGRGRGRADDGSRLDQGEAGIHG